jgi:hypothetical protein
MKNIVIFLFFILLGTTSCNHFDEIKGSTTRRVVYIRDYAMFSRNEGGHINDKVFGPGQWDHQTAGPAIGYDFDVAQEQFEATPKVVMADKLTMNAKWVWQYHMKDDANALKDALFNFVKTSTLKAGEDAYKVHGGNELQNYPIVSDEIFANYAAPFADQAFKDVLCRYTSAKINTELIAAKGFEEAKAALSAIKYPKFVVGVDGLVSFSPTDSISILDVIDLTGVTFNQYEMPQEVKAIIAEVEDTRSTYQALTRDRERVAVQAQTKIEKAALMQKKNAIMDQIIKANPNVLQFAAQQKLSEILKSKEVKAKLIVVPSSGGAQLHIN